MAMTVNGVNPYVGIYNGVSGIEQKPVQETSTASNHPSVSTGASDYAINVHPASSIGEPSQSVQNTQNVSSALKISLDAANNTIDALTAIRENVIKAANDTSGSLDRQAIQKEINRSIAQIDMNAYVQYNGMNMLDGSRNNMVLAGIDGYESFQTGDLRAQTLGLTDEQGNVKIDVSTADSAEASLRFVDAAATRAGNILDSMHVLGDYVVDGISVESIIEDISTGISVDKKPAQNVTLQNSKSQELNFVTIGDNPNENNSNDNNYEMTRRVINFPAQHLQNIFNQNPISISQLLS